MDGFFNIFIKLKDISQNKGERISDSRFFAKTFIRIWNSNLRNSHFMLIYSWKNAHPSNKANVHPGISIFCTWWMINNRHWVLSEWTIEIPVKSSQLYSLSLRSSISPGSKHRTSSFRKFSNHMHPSQIFIGNSRTIRDTF